MLLTLQNEMVQIFVVVFVFAIHIWCMAGLICNKIARKHKKESEEKKQF